MRIRRIKIQAEDYTITPKITFGAKAFHFSTEKEDAFKAITRANFNSCPDGSKVFISFGEIDCRLNEGFMHAAAKHKKLMVDLINETVSGYLVGFLNKPK